MLTAPRDFVSTYWPNPGTPGSKVRNMYDRIVLAENSQAGRTSEPAATAAPAEKPAEKPAEAKQAEAAETNGQTATA
jgi:hypothetical protein